MATSFVSGRVAELPQWEKKITAAGGHVHWARTAEEAKEGHYLVFITGPSRTADIELTVTLGVYGPKNLFVWMMEG